jgi:mRNA interferase MazF
MRRGEIYLVGFLPGPPGAIGGEIRKPRPAVLVTTDAAIRRLNRVQVVPLSSQRLDYLRPWESPVSAASTGDRPSKAMADQIRTVAKERLGRRLGQLTAAELADLAAALRLQLGL